MFPVNAPRIKMPNAGEKIHKTDDNEENFGKLQMFGENVRKEYEKLYTDMWNSLSESHLEPFADILLEREGIVLKDREQTMESIRKQLQNSMVYALNFFWEDSGVNEALTSLEMLKEKFKSYEGNKWSIDVETPLKRTMPIRMRFKEYQLRYLQAQLKFQEDQLDQILQENTDFRKQIQNVKEQRIFLMESLVEHRKKFQAALPEISRLRNLVLEDRLEN
ncbi:uncharacterized protein LOC106090732 [Stomoxys calcitrans]|uniref:Uncharacterized protein n=1 Tax=Stomoxys calcitrans TaxID=35570 RepID=A0A1I8NPT1_STOCA|nr:uncharacterized protein LOC106090732 [Stomoxys calcitrans]